ncbi:MAG: hypothetical protein LBP19_01065 [Treponema sp.]|jgi:hypothetical protein|nr:hypothetical protein [Treponema sp.]
MNGYRDIMSDFSLYVTAAVIDTLAAVTMPGPNRPITFALNMLEITVPLQIITETYPAARK